MKQGSTTLLGVWWTPGVRQYLLWAVRSCLGHVAWSRSVGVVHDVGGEISSEFAPCAFERSPPHLFLYLFLFNKTKVQTSKDSASCKHQGVQTFIEFAKNLNFFYFVF